MSGDIRTGQTRTPPYKGVRLSVCPVRAFVREFCLVKNPTAKSIRKRPPGARIRARAAHKLAGPVMTICSVCHRPLHDPISARRGIGPVCWGQLHPEARQQRRQARPRRRSRSSQQLALPFEKVVEPVSSIELGRKTEMKETVPNSENPKKEHLPIDRAVLECWGLAQPEHIRKRHYPHAKSHLVTELVALRAGSYSARLCRRCVKSELSHTYPGGLWWTTKALT